MHHFQKIAHTRRRPDFKDFSAMCGLCKKRPGKQGFTTKQGRAVMVCDPCMIYITSMQKYRDLYNVDARTIA